MLLVEVPPHGTESRWASEPASRARLTNARDWFVQAPVEVRVRSGRVTAASLDLPSIRDAAN